MSKESPASWAAQASALTWRSQPFIDGRPRQSTAPDVFRTTNPATGAPLHEMPMGSVEDIDAAVLAARRAFDDGRWSRQPATQRAAALFRLADLIAERSAELALLDSLEMGKPIQAALFEAAQLTPLMLRSWAGFADKLHGDAAALGTGTMSFTSFEPRGVVGSIIPWNCPTLNAIYKIGPALAAGNTIVLKPSEIAPSSSLRIAELAAEAGIPDGVVNVVPGPGSPTGSALAAHADVDMVTFTGSTTTGRKIIEMCGRSNGKKMIIECGGKSPHVVFDDVNDLDAVAAAVTQGLLWNQGQVCSAHTRLLVHDAIHDPLLERIVQQAQAQQPADPLLDSTTFGPLASTGQRDRVRGYVERGVAEGATLALKGEISDDGGCYVGPSIFDQVDGSMAIAQEEIFGPVLCVQTFGTEEEAIACANETRYALSATAWTRDLGRGQRVAHAIKAGQVAVRTSGEEGPPAHTLGMFGAEPQKASGFGTEVGLKGLESYSTMKWTTFTGA